MFASVTKQYNLVPGKGVIRLARKVTAGHVESNGSLYHMVCVFMTLNNNNNNNNTTVV